MGGMIYKLKGSNGYDHTDNRLKPIEILDNKFYEDVFCLTSNNERIYIGKHELGDMIKHLVDIMENWEK